ncbi:hypothetical protein SNE40_023547 [Patella caerulea]|uniref:C-type lectin domain-containing protein n=1 Tax=Patella caerulea TaxID=87958 RepID=A0AAN8J0F2_PATCE
MELAMAPTDQKYQELMNYLTNLNLDDKGVWIGIKWNSTFKVCQWLSGQLLITADWKTDEPRSRNCVSFTNEEHQWNTRDCHDVRPFICEKPEHDSEPRFKFYETSKDFTAANEQCIRDGRRLPILLSIEDRVALKQFMIDNTVHRDVYLGITKNDVDDRFYWLNGGSVNGDTYTWSNDNTNKPNNLHLRNDGFHYGALDTRPYICEGDQVGTKVTEEWFGHVFARLSTNVNSSTVPIQDSPVQEHYVMIKTRCAMLCYNSIQCYYFTFHLQHCKLYGNITYTSVTNGNSVWSKFTL